MKRALVGLFCLVLIAAFTGCSGGGSSVPAGGDGGAPSSDESPSGESQVSVTPAVEAPAMDAPAEAPAVEAPAVETPAEAPAAAPAEAAPAAAAPAAAGDLTGSKWTLEGIEMEFRADNKVFLKGGPLAALAPDGLEATYTLTGTAISVDVMGESHEGTWDGTKLVVDGKEAVKAP